MRLAFYKANGTFYDGLIRFVTHGPYSHCELVFSDGRWFSSSPRDGGVRFKYIQPKPDAWDYFEIPINPSQELEMYMFCQSQVGCGYDWVGVARFVLPVLQPSKRRWFCSEICVAALQRVGLLLGARACNFSPNGLASLLGCIDQH